MKYAAKELMEFLDYVIDKGLQSRATAQSRKTAAAKVLDVLDEGEKQDLRSLDRESAFARFMNLNKKTYSPESFQVYRSRFNSALDDFLRYVDDPSGFRPVTSGKPVRSKTAVENSRPTKKGRPSEPEKKSTPTLTLALPAPEPMLEIPVPLSDGKIARLLLPKSLNKADAERISALVSAYAVS